MFCRCLCPLLPFFLPWRCESCSMAPFLPSLALCILLHGSLFIVLRSSFSCSSFGFLSPCNVRIPFDVRKLTFHVRYIFSPIRLAFADDPPRRMQQHASDHVALLPLHSKAKVLSSTPGRARFQDPCIEGHPPAILGASQSSKFQFGMAGKVDTCGFTSAASASYFFTLL